MKLRGGERSIAVAMLASIAALSGCDPGGSAHAQPARPPKDPQAELETLLRQMGTSGNAPVLSGTPAQRAAQLRAFVREHMKQDAFYDNVLPRLFPTLSMRVWGILPFHLHRTEVNGRELYYGMTAAETVRTFPRPAPCDVADAVEVRPWWDLRKKVLVCADSYKPDVVKRAGTDRYCEATHVDALFDGHAEGCGCGKHLINCLPELALRAKIQTAYQEEPRRTIQRVIRDDRPFSEILTGNATVRSDLASFFYARSKALGGGALDLPALGPDSEKPSLRPRDPAFDGGVLTTPLYRFNDEAPRVLLGRVFLDFLCMDLPSTQVKTSEIFTLDDAELRAKSLMGLASKPGCRDCHARLEHGLQFFQGWSSVRDGQRLETPAQRVKTSRLYGMHAEDLRAEGPATTAWFGRALSQQPELARCQTRKVLDFVYGGHAVPEVVQARLQQAFARKQRFAELFEEAVVARYAGGDAAAERRVAAAEPFAAAIDGRCGGCHGVAEGPVSLDGLDRRPDLALRAALRVSAGEMPPDTALDPSTRESLVLGLCGAGKVSEGDCRKWYLPAHATAPSPHPAVLLRGARARAEQVVGEARSGGRAQSLVGESGDGLVLRNNVTIEAAMLLLADTLCAGRGDAERCVAAVLNGAFRRIPQP